MITDVFHIWGDKDLPQWLDGSEKSMWKLKEFEVNKINMLLFSGYVLQHNARCHTFFFFSKL